MLGHSIRRPGCKATEAGHRGNIHNGAFDLMLKHVVNSPFRDHRRRREIELNDTIPQFPLKLAGRIEAVHHSCGIHDVVQLAEHLLCFLEQVVERRVLGNVGVEDERAFWVGSGDFLLEVGEEILVDIADDYVGAFQEELLCYCSTEAAAGACYESGLMAGRWRNCQCRGLKC
jgi:hypothetical protein